MESPPLAGEPPAERRWGRLEIAHVLALLLVTCVHWAPRLRGPIDLRYDGGVYYVLGTALAQGKGYRLLNEPGEIQAIQYPPLWPAWIALHERVLGTDDPLVVGHALRLTNVALSLAYAFCVYALARRLLTAWPAFLATLASVLYFHTLFLEDLCFAEQPFALVTVLFLLSAAHERRWIRALSYPLAVAAFYLRTAGIALFAAWVLEPLTRRRFGLAGARAVVCALAVLAWQWHVSSVIHGPEYQHPAYAYQRAPYQYYNVSYAENVALRDPFAPELGRITPVELVQRAMANLPRLALGLGESVSAPRGFWEWLAKSVTGQNYRSQWFGLLVIPIAEVAALVVAGAWLLLRDQRLLALLLLCSLGLVALTPWPAQFARYLAPLTWLLAIALARALGALRRRAPAIPPVTWALVIAVQCFTLRQTMKFYHFPVEYHAPQERTVAGKLFLFEEPGPWRGFYDALSWLREHTEPDDVIATSAPHLVWLHAERKAVMPPLEPDVEEAQRLLDTVPVDYALVDELHFVDLSRRYAKPVLVGHPDLWELVHTDPRGVEIYRRRR